MMKDLIFIGFWNGDSYVIYFPELHCFWDRSFDIGFNGKVIFGRMILDNFEKDRVFRLSVRRKEEFLRKRVEVFLSRPAILSFFIVTNKCNLSCEFCYANANSDLSDPQVSVEDFMDLLKKGVGFSKRLSISGGEPLLYFDLIRKIYDEVLLGKTELCIYTNGLLLDKEILEWMKERRVFLYVNMDFDREGVKSHLGEVLREKLERLVCDYPWLVKRIESSVVLYPSELVNLDEMRRKQIRFFEKGIVKFYNFTDNRERGSVRDGCYDDNLIKEGLLKELDLVEKGELDFNLSLFVVFFRKILVNMLLGGWGLMSCDPSVTLRYDRKLFLCQVVASNVSLNVKSDVYVKNYICDLDDFDLAVYRNKLLRSRVWVKDCVLRSNCLVRWFCGEICWSNLEFNLFLCRIYFWGLLSVLYLIIRYRRDLFDRLLKLIGISDVDVKDVYWEVLVDGS